MRKEELLNDLLVELEEQANNPNHRQVADIFAAAGYERVDDARVRELLSD